MNYAYKAFQTNAASAYTNPSPAANEFTSTEYSNVQSENAVYASHSGTASVNLKYANVAQKYDFLLDTYYGSITDLTVIWKGYIGGTPDTAKLQVLQADGTQTPPPSTTWQDWVASLPSSNTEETKDLGTGTNYIFYAGGHYWVRFGAFGTYQKAPDTGTITLYTDYAALIVTVSTGGTTYTFTEYANITETFNDKKQFLQTNTENGALAEGFQDKKTLLQPFTETPNLTETMQDQKQLLQILQEIPGLTENSQNLLELMQTFQENPMVNEALNDVRHLIFPFTESGNATDSLTSFMAFIYSFTETGGIVETMQTLTIIIYCFTEPASIIETFQSIVPALDNTIWLLIIIFIFSFGGFTFMAIQYGRKKATINP